MRLRSGFGQGNWLYTLVKFLNEVTPRKVDLQTHQLAGTTPPFSLHLSICLLICWCTHPSKAPPHVPRSLHLSVRSPLHPSVDSHIPLHPPTYPLVHPSTNLHCVRSQACISRFWSARLHPVLYDCPQPLHLNSGHLLPPRPESGEPGPNHAVALLLAYRARSVSAGKNCPGNRCHFFLVIFVPFEDAEHRPKVNNH